MIQAYCPGASLSQLSRPSLPPIQTAVVAGDQRERQERVLGARQAGGQRAPLRFAGVLRVGPAVPLGVKPVAVHAGAGRPEGLRGRIGRARRHAAAPRNAARDTAASRGATARAAAGHATAPPRPVPPAPTVAPPPAPPRPARAGRGVDRRPGGAAVACVVSLGCARNAADRAGACRSCDPTRADHSAGAAPGAERVVGRRSVGRVDPAPVQ